MTTLINKSNHPVYIKKINVRIWTLRDEIEAVIQKRVEEHGLENVQIEDIQKYYSSLVPRPVTAADAEDDMNVQPGIEDTSELNEEDIPDDAMNEMAAAMAEAEQEESGDKGEDSEEESDDAANDLAAEMLGDQNEETKEEKEDTPPFERVRPDESKMIPGFAFLSEVHMDQILLFSKRNYTKGQSIIVEFMIPNRFSISTEVINCISIERKSKIISETSPTHRVQCATTFLFDGERETLRQFLKSIEPDIPPPPKKLKKAEEEDDDEDEFDDLGF